MKARTSAPLPMSRVAAASTDLLVGVVAGLVASWAMNQFQTAWTYLANESEPEETAASKAADALSERASGVPIKKSKRKSADTVLHYVAGLLIGGTYGLIGGLFPSLFIGRGLLFGV